MAAKMQKNGSAFYKKILLTELFLFQLETYLLRRTMLVRCSEGLARSKEPGIVAI